VNNNPVSVLTLQNFINKHITKKFNVKKNEKDQFIGRDAKTN